MKEEQLKRIARHTIMFNNREIQALNAYCSKYKITNKSRFMQETIITAILKKFDKDYPSLWDDGEKNLFNQ